VSLSSVVCSFICPSSIQRFIVVFNLSIVSSFVRSIFSLVLNISARLSNVAHVYLFTLSAYDWREDRSLVKWLRIAASTCSSLQTRLSCMKRGYTWTLGTATRYLTVSWRRARVSLNWVTQLLTWISQDLSSTFISLKKQNIIRLWYEFMFCKMQLRPVVFIICKQTLGYKIKLNYPFSLWKNKIVIRTFYFYHLLFQINIEKNNI